MPRATGRATQRDIDDVHRMATKAIKVEFKYYSKKKERVPAALLANALKLLQLSGATDAARNPGKQHDRLAGMLREFDDDEGANEVPDSGKGSRPKVDFTLDPFPDSAG